MEGFVFIQTFSLTLHSTKVHLCTAISIVRRPNFSSCMRMVSNHDLYFIVVDRFPSFWTAGDRSYRNHHQSISKKVVTPSGPRENQGTVKRDGFYEWGIWRTIMRTMGGNSSICIKINSWPQYDRAPPAPLPTIGPYRSIFSTAGPPWSDQIKRGPRQHLSLLSVPYRPIF